MSSASMDLQNQERSQMDGYYTLDTWNKPNATIAPPPAVPTITYKRGYVKPKKSKLRWYLVFGLSVLITAVVVVVVALVIHFTTSRSRGHEIKDGYHQDEDSGKDHVHGHTDIQNPVTRRPEPKPSTKRVQHTTQNTREPMISQSTHRRTHQPSPKTTTSTDTTKASTRTVIPDQTLNKSLQPDIPSTTSNTAKTVYPTKHTSLIATERHSENPSSVANAGSTEKSSTISSTAISSSNTPSTTSLNPSSTSPSTGISKSSATRLLSSTTTESSISSQPASQAGSSPSQTSVPSPTPKPTISSSALQQSSETISSAKPTESSSKSSLPIVSPDKLISPLPSSSPSRPADTLTILNLTNLIDNENVTQPFETSDLNDTTTTMSLEELSSATISHGATAPPFIRDHSGSVTETSTNIHDSSSGSTFIAPTDGAVNEPVIILESSNVTLSSKSISLLFEAINIPDWDYLQIFRYEEGSVGEVVAMVTAGRLHPVLDIYDSSFTSQISFKDDALAVTLQTNSFNCNKTTNFTSILGTYTATYINVTSVYVIQEPPTLIVPHAIVEGKNMTMTCSAELFGSNGRLVWKFRPPGLDMYFDLSSSHTTSQEWNNCTTTINSTLIFTPQSHDNGSYFRCEVVDADLMESTQQTLHTDTEFLVVPSTFCADKRTYTVHPHPYNPCNLVVYCFQTGPLVYHINCSPGTCYDRNKTKCVPVNTPQD